MKNKMISIVFCSIIGMIMIVNMASPDQALSYAERRPLAQKPEINQTLLLGGKLDTELEQYALDQFVGRDQFRMIKALTDLKVFQKLDNNNIYVENNNIFKQDYPLNDQSVVNMAKKLDAVYEMYLKDCRVVLGIIPDKSDFAVDRAPRLSADYKDMTSLLLSNLKMPIEEVYPGAPLHEGTVSYLNLRRILTLDDYYNTDLHWRQERLSNVVSAIGDLFDFSTAYDKTVPPHKTTSYHPFYGAYYGQAALKLPADTITYVQDIYTENSLVTDFDQGKKEPATSIYNTGKLGSVDSYDVYFSGNSPLITIDNPLNTTGKELIIFRDSFGSSLAPLLLEGYSKITLIDLRFIPASNVGTFVNFSNQDVLLLYGQAILNSSDMIKL